MHIVENRVVITWIHDDKPSGLITGKRHLDTHGFEVDHIVRFPETEPGLGEQMCQELIQEVINKFKLHWIIVKISDNYKPKSLSAMAKRFGFSLLRREENVEYWWKGAR